MATDLSKRSDEGRRADYRPAGTDGKSSLFATVKRTFTEFSEDNMSDWAAALTYYGLLSMFPALIALVSIVGLVGDPATTTKAITDMVTKVGPSSAADTFAGPIKSITSNRGTAGVLFIVGLGTALWSASAYVGAFMRAANIVYETPEGRPFWKLRPLQILVTLVMLVMLALVAVALVLTGPIVTAVAGPLGIGSTAVSIWNIAKWPVLLIVMVTMFAVLFYSAPNVKLVGFKWVTPGALLAIVLWLRRVGGVRVLRGQLRLLRQDLRHPRWPGLPARVDVDHERRAAARHGAQLRARAQSRTGRRRAWCRPRAAARRPLEAEAPEDHLARTPVHQSTPRKRRRNDHGYPESNRLGHR